MNAIPKWTRWALVGVIVVVALAVAVWPRDNSDPPGNQPSVAAEGPSLTMLRQKAALPPCPAASGQPSGGPLRGLTLHCLADGASVDLGAALAGKPALLNLWAYWCQPCARELPAIDAFARRAGSAVTVLTIHSDPQEAKGLALLSDLGLNLAGAQDANASVRSAVGAPAVLPISVLVRADGTIANVIVRAFDNVEDIADTVERELGVAT